MFFNNGIEIFMIRKTAPFILIIISKSSPSFKLCFKQQRFLYGLTFLIKGASLKMILFLTLFHTCFNPLSIFYGKIS